MSSLTCSKSGVLLVFFDIGGSGSCCVVRVKGVTGVRGVIERGGLGDLLCSVVCKLIFSLFSIK